MKARNSTLALGTSAALLALVVACSTLPRGARAPASPPYELPWEVIDDKGETLVPDVTYAEDSQNEQIMPLAVSTGAATGPRSTA